MSTSVARQEDQFLALELSKHERVGGGAEGGFDRAPFDILQTVDFV